jgi:hypothetical protein
MKKLLKVITVTLLLIGWGGLANADNLPTLQTGIQDQPLPDITISESLAKPSDFESGAENKMALRFPEGVRPTVPGQVFTTSGDLVLDPAGSTVTQGIDLGRGLTDQTHYYLWCKVKSPGTEPSSVIFHGIKVTLDRTVAQGDLKVSLLGDYINNTQSQFPGEDYPSVAVAHIVTNATKGKNAAKFVIGQRTYWANGVEETLDTIPLIDQGGRALLPVRALSEALGAHVYWDQDSQTVSILKDDSAVAVQVNSKILNVNGVAVHMDTTAVNLNGRMMLPFRPIAEALGAKVVWDEANQTLNLN